MIKQPQVTQDARDCRDLVPGFGFLGAIVRCERSGDCYQRLDVIVEPAVDVGRGEPAETPPAGAAIRALKRLLGKIACELTATATCQPARSEPDQDQILVRLKAVRGNCGTQRQLP